MGTLFLFGHRGTAKFLNSDAIKSPDITSCIFPYHVQLGGHILEVTQTKSFSAQTLKMPARSILLHIKVAT